MLDQEKFSEKNLCPIHLCNFNLFIYLSQPLNQWTLLSTRLFRQLNYWRSASYATCFAIHVDLTWPCGCIHTCLSAMYAASAFYLYWLQGNLQLRRGRTINKHSKAPYQCPLTTRLRSAISHINQCDLCEFSHKLMWI